MGKKIFVIPIAWHNECDSSNNFFGFGSTVPQNKFRVLLYNSLQILLFWKGSLVY